MCPTVYSSVLASSLANVHCTESLVWFKTLALVTPSILDSNQDSGIITVCHEDSALSTSQPFADDKDFWVGQFRVLDVGLGGS